MASPEETERRRRSFDSFASHYDRVRPGYPSAVIDDIERCCGLTEKSRILEIGPGTGQATRLFAHKGMGITALEPSPALAAIARENLAAFPYVNILEQAFEDTDLADKEFDLIYAAQSFHWVDSPAGFKKMHALLRENGRIAAFWNLKRPLSSPLQETFEQLYRSHFRAEPWFCMNADCLERSTRQRRESIEANGLFSVSALRSYCWLRQYTSKEYLELIDSYADHRLLPDGRKRKLYSGIAAAIDAQGAILDIPYTTVVFLCERRLDCRG